MRYDSELPSELTPLLDDLETSAEVVAVVLGGSRAEGTGDEQSDWDLGVYYRGTPDLAPLRRWGDVHAPGAWGRIMNGGAWLRLGEHKVDVLDGSGKSAAPRSGKSAVSRKGGEG